VSYSGMNDDRQYRVTTRERDTGGWMYQLFLIGGNPLTWESDNKDYVTQHEAERAGHEAIAAKRDKGRL
jgi:hypothetical protein